MGPNYGALHNCNGSHRCLGVEQYLEVPCKSPSRSIQARISVTTRSWIHGESIFLNNLIKTMDIFYRESLRFPNILRSISDFDVNGTCPEIGLSTLDPHINMPVISINSLPKFKEIVR